MNNAVNPLTKNPIRLLVVDDSRFIRRAICKIIAEDGSIEVTGEAANGEEALEMIFRLDPDVVILDINMPVMDGLTALKHIMIKCPRPTVMFSSLTQEGADITFDTLKYGAVDFIPKPSRLSNDGLKERHERMIRKIKLAAGVEMEAVRYLRSGRKKTLPDIVFCEECGSKNIINSCDKGRGFIRCRSCNDKIAVSGSDKLNSRNNNCKYLCAIGASEGGYRSLLKIIPELRPDIQTAFIIIIYDALKHVDAFADYIDNFSYVRVKKAEDGEIIQGGVCYLAGGSEYVTINSINSEYRLLINASPFQMRKRSINMLMFSVAETMKQYAIGAILSGSGNDGTEGIAEIIRLDGRAVAQNPRHCFCGEMAQSVIDNCKVDNVISDTQIAGEINSMVCNCSGVGG